MLATKHCVVCIWQRPLLSAEEKKKLCNSFNDGSITLSISFLCILDALEASAVNKRLNFPSFQMRKYFLPERTFDHNSAWCAAAIVHCRNESSCVMVSCYRKWIVQLNQHKNTRNVLCHCYYSCTEAGICCTQNCVHEFEVLKMYLLLKMGIPIGIMYSFHHWW